MSLSEAMASLSPQPTIGAIRLQLMSDVGKDKCFVIVEGLDDRVFYSRFLKEGETCEIHESTKENGETGGNRYLKDIVKEVLSWKISDRIIGITDSDYFVFDKRYTFPQHVFHTDCHDMEMMVLSSKNVLHKFFAYDSSLELKLKENDGVARELGRLRLCNYLFDLGVHFKKKLKYSLVVDSTSRELKDNWKLCLHLRFFELAAQKELYKCEKEVLVNLIRAVYWLSRNDLSTVSSFDLCQGHDTLKLLAYRYKDENNHSYIKLWDLIGGEYKLDDFYKTHLYMDLKDFEKQHNVDFLK